MAYTGSHLREKKHRLRAARTRTRAAWAAARNWFRVLRLLMEDIDLSRPHTAVTGTPVIPETPVLEATAPPVMTPQELLQDLHAKCRYLPQGLPWVVSAAGIAVELDALDGTNAALTRVVNDYAAALRVRIVERLLSDGTVVLDAAGCAGGVAVVVRVTLARECEPSLRIEQAAHAAMDDTQVFDAIPADLVDVPDVGTARLVGAALGAREVDW